MNRRGFMGSAVMAATLAATGLRAEVSPGAPFPPDHPLQAAWQAWKTLCLAPDGRIVDGFQNAASHSEGQGYGLTLAAIFGDKAACEQIILWTEQNLTVRSDALLAWRWQQDSDPHITDRNNASDGDLFYAWGLVLTSRLEDRPELADRARRIAEDLVRHCVAGHPDGSGLPVLLPGATGFRTDAGLVINPSYYMPRALREVGLATGTDRLAGLAQAGTDLIGALAGRGLVPDWVTLTPGGFAPPPAQFSSASGYEAVRVPLFAMWSDQADGEALRRYTAAMAAAGDQGGTPTVLSPADGKTLERSPHPGYAALAALASCVSGGIVGSLMPVFSTEQPYYPATLHLMALVAQATTYPRCVPI